MKVFILDNGLDLSYYVCAVNKTGAQAILSSHLDLSSRCDALLLTGGLNVSPYLYGSFAENNLVNSDIDLQEYCLIRRFYDTKRLIVGVCKGMQILNVFFGGTLEKVRGHQAEHDFTSHEIKFTKPFPFVSKTVNSRHEERVQTLGDNLIVCARSNDNTIEALKHENNLIYGVQFHPERLGDYLSLQFYGKFFC